MMCDEVWKLISLKTMIVKYKELFYIEKSWNFRYISMRFEIRNDMIKD